MASNRLTPFDVDRLAAHGQPIRHRAAAYHAERKDAWVIAWAPNRSITLVATTRQRPIACLRDEPSGDHFRKEAAFLTHWNDLFPRLGIREGNSRGFDAAPVDFLA